MKHFILAMGLFFCLAYHVNAQTQQDTLDIKQAALDYIESQHDVKPEKFERAAHPRMIKRTFWTNKQTQKEYLRETFTDAIGSIS